MRQRKHDDRDEHSATWDAIYFPRNEPSTPETLERRQMLLEEAKRLREAISSIGITTDDLIHLAR